MGVEIAENLAEAGLKVSVEERSDRLIAPLDFDMAADVHRYIRTKGINLYLNNGVNAIEGKTVILQKGEINADMIIMSVGVRPETNLARECGIPLNSCGSIIVNSKAQTCIPEIFAVDDAVEAEDCHQKACSYTPCRSCEL